MDFIIANGANILAILGAIYTLASVIAIMTPTDTDNKIVGWIGSLANRFGYTFKAGAIIKN